MPRLARLYGDGRRGAHGSAWPHVFYRLGWRVRSGEGRAHEGRPHANQGLRLHVQYALGRVSSDVRRGRRARSTTCRTTRSSSSATRRPARSPTTRSTSPRAEGPPLRRPHPRPRRSQAGRAAHRRTRAPDPDRPGQGLPLRGTRPMRGPAPWRHGANGWPSTARSSSPRRGGPLLGAPPPRPPAADRARALRVRRRAVETGPDTFAVFRAAHGRVGLSSTFRRSGYRSVEIRDVPGNGDFSELQGYFPEQRTGHVFAHFALLTARPEEELNVALAGPRRFRLGKDGIAFWLSTREGRFVHVSDSIPRKLAPVRGVRLVRRRRRLRRGGRPLRPHHPGGRPGGADRGPAQPAGRGQPARLRRGHVLVHQRPHGRRLRRDLLRRRRRHRDQPRRGRAPAGRARPPQAVRGCLRGVPAHPGGAPAVPAGDVRRGPGDPWGRRGGRRRCRRPARGAVAGRVSPAGGGPFRRGTGTVRGVRGRPPRGAALWSGWRPSP